LAYQHLIKKMHDRKEWNVLVKKTKQYNACHKRQSLIIISPNHPPYF